MKNVTIARPLAASLILAAILVVAGLALAAAWADLADATAEREAKAGIVSRRPPLGSANAANRGSVAAKSLYVEAESETLAAAQMDAVVRATVTGAGGAVSSTRAETKPDEASGSEHIEIQASIEASNDALQAILFRLESGSPMALVDAITVEPADVSEAGARENAAPNLHATMTLSAYWAKPKP